MDLFFLSTSALPYAIVPWPHIPCPLWYQERGLYVSPRYAQFRSELRVELVRSVLSADLTNFPLCRGREGGMDKGVFHLKKRSISTSDTSYLL